MRPHAKQARSTASWGRSRSGCPSEPPNMRSLPYALPALSLFLPRAVLGSAELLLDCASDDGRADDECRRPMSAVTKVTPGAYYIAKIACPDCAVQEFSGEGENRTYSLVQKDNDLVGVATISLGSKQANRRSATVLQHFSHARSPHAAAERPARIPVALYESASAVHIDPANTPQFHAQRPRRYPCMRP